MKKISFYLLFILLVQGCGDAATEKVLKMEDIAPKAKSISKQTKDNTDKKELIGFSQLAAQWVGLTFDSIVSLDSLFFNDRFTPKKSFKFKLYNSTNETLFTQWIFKDSNATYNAFYNWLDCFGEPCKSISIGQKRALQKDNCFILLNDTSYTYISAKVNLPTKKWLTYFDTLSHSPNWKLIIEQHHKKTTWNSMKNRVLIPIKK